MRSRAWGFVCAGLTLAACGPLRPLAEDAGAAGGGTAGGGTAGGGTAGGAPTGGGAGGGGGGGSDLDSGTPDGGEPGPRVVAVRVLKPVGGGRVDWCRTGEWIAYDNVDLSGTWSVRAMRPDGGGDHCITCATPGLPAGVRGQPAWAPGCDWLVIQGPSSTLPSGNIAQKFLEPGWGINADLWFVPASGASAIRAVQTTSSTEAALHPHFSADGTRLFWTSRDPTGTVAEPDRGFPWNGWYLSVAALSYDDAGTPAVGVTVPVYRIGQPNQRGFFESHALQGGALWFSRTLAPPDGGQNTFVDEGYRAQLTSLSLLTNLTDGAGAWDEHSTPSPSGATFAFMSSRGTGAAFPPGSFKDLASEIWTRPADLSAPPHRLTDFASTLSATERANGVAVVASDFDWAPDGRALVVYFVKKLPTGEIISQSIAVLELDAAY